MIDLSRFRGIAEKLYTGKCDIFEYKSNTKGLIKYQETKVFENIPCRISYKNNSSSKENEVANSAEQAIVFFVAPDIDIKPGSKIIVTQNGRTVEYKSSGEPAVYQTHQEIRLELFKGWC
ncbi:MAG: hypothetical protein Q4D26_09210 [Clostridia bacterium]|nr:hypothetical protein [Clostridia bacterium]